MKTEEGFELRLRPRAMETVSIEIPKDALDSLKKVAAIRDVSDQALLRFYIGEGLRKTCPDCLMKSSCNWEAAKNFGC